MGVLLASPAEGAATAESCRDPAAPLLSLMTHDLLADCVENLEIASSAASAETKSATCQAGS